MIAIRNYFSSPIVVWLKRWSYYLFRGRSSRFFSDFQNALMPIDSKTFYTRHSISRNASEMFLVGPRNLGTIRVARRPVQFRFGITFRIPRIYRIFSRPSNEDRLSYRNARPVLDTENHFPSQEDPVRSRDLSVPLFHSHSLILSLFLSYG